MILIIGAGIAGLSLARELQRAGSPVTIIEAGDIASGASGVATSYLEPRLGDTPMRVMEREALRRWENYAAELEEQSGLDVEFRREGQLRVTIAEYAKKLEKDLTAREKQGGSFERLSALDVQKLEPELSGDIVEGAFLPDVRWVAGNRVCAALAEIVTGNGGTLLRNSSVTTIKNSPNQVSALLQDGTKISGDSLVLCTGMGANSLDGLPSDIPISRPVRGVNLLLDMSGLGQPITRLIKHHRGNLCPRSGGRLIVGTTYEAEEHSLEVSPEVVEMLYQNAEPILPCVRNLPLIAVQAGIRAKVGDGLLRLGRSKLEPRLYFSLSHAGAGFLRAPVIAKELAGFVLSGVCGEFTEVMTKGDV